MYVTQGQVFIRILYQHMVIVDPTMHSVVAIHYSIHRSSADSHGLGQHTVIEPQQFDTTPTHRAYYGHPIAKTFLTSKRWPI